MTFAALQPLAERASLFAAYRQDALATAVNALGDHRWDADLGAGTLTFTASDDSSHQVVTKPTLIATIAPGPRSMLWAWAHPQGDPSGVAGQLRDYGTQYELTDLAQPELAFPEDAPADGEKLDAWILRTAEQIGTIATEITGRSPHFSAPVGGGTRAVFLLDAPIPPTTVADAVIATPRLLPALTLTDARSALWDAARLAGWNLQWVDEAFSAAMVSDASGTATFRFDEHARIIGVESQLGG
ncbi:DUF6882 domain-containing protein [uncultured Microbacterium sp.]|uniref:DUF6882 domain-containing protein n=1 Tax=uncultured Microbacterium sp. TaxID=191216 RepID=UPI0026328DE6|nr:DUF6882 domain-containing protein [uncultured Microbacterium sp.]